MAFLDGIFTVLLKNLRGKIKPKTLSVEKKCETRCEYADHTDNGNRADLAYNTDHAEHTTCADHVDQAGGRRHLQSG